MRMYLGNNCKNVSSDEVCEKHFLRTRRISALTLAEALVTLLVIGIAAALVMPSLVNNFKQKQYEVQIKSFKQKFQEGMDTMRLRNKLMPVYDSTMDFVKEMQKHFNITQVCDSSHLGDCFEGDFTAKVYDENGNETAYKTYSPKNLSDAKSVSPTTDIDGELVGVKFADGSGAIITRKKGCSGPSNTEVNGDVFKCLGYIAFVGGSKSHSMGRDMITNMDLVSETMVTAANTTSGATPEEISCGENATNISGECKCNADYYGDGTTCTACSSDKTSSIGSTTESDCKCKTGYDPWCLSFEIVAVVPPSNTLCSSATERDSNDGAYCYLSKSQETTEVINKYNLQVPVVAYNDYWGGAMKYCVDRGWKIPTETQVSEIYSKIYHGENGEQTCEYTSEFGCNGIKIEENPLRQYLAKNIGVPTLFSSDLQEGGPNHYEGDTTVKIRSLPLSRGWYGSGCTRYFFNKPNNYYAVCIKYNSK